MPRANRYHVPGLVWHITHRCHNRDFLLNYRKDRDRYRHWLWEARKRYGLCLLNYIFTSNHIHLIVHDAGNPGVIEQSMKLAQARIAQEYNIRNRRVGAFWQDRYHATAVQSDRHLRRCMTYVDMNMVRAGAASHPAMWPSAGFHEIQHPPERYRLLDLEKTQQLLGFSTHRELAAWQTDQILEAVNRPLQRESCWTSAVAVGDRPFLLQVADQLGLRARHREVIDAEGLTVLREAQGGYNANSSLINSR